MNNQETFQRIVQLISTALSIPSEIILSDSKHCEIIDARYILVKVLHRHGFYPTQIAQLLKQSPANIRHIINLYDTRLSTNKQFSYNVQTVYKALENNAFTP